MKAYFGSNQNNCNTLKFASFENRFKIICFWILCSWNTGKRKIFIKLKFIIRFSNMFVHTCPCIWFIWLSGFDWKFKMVEIAFANEIKNGFERKKKENLKIKYFKKMCKFYFLRTYQKFSILFELKSAFQIIFKFDLFHVLNLVWIKKGK